MPIEDTGEDHVGKGSLYEARNRHEEGGARLRGIAGVARDSSVPHPVRSEVQAQRHGQLLCRGPENLVVLAVVAPRFTDRGRDEATREADLVRAHEFEDSL